MLANIADSAPRRSSPRPWPSSPSGDHHLRQQRQPHHAGQVVTLRWRCTRCTSTMEAAGTSRSGEIEAPGVHVQRREDHGRRYLSPNGDNAAASTQRKQPPALKRGGSSLAPTASAPTSRDGLAGANSATTSSQNSSLRSRRYPRNPHPPTTTPPAPELPTTGTDSTPMP
jgi:hypothetical protein